MILTKFGGQEESFINTVEMSNDEIKAEYTSSLADLTFNSKPLINVLTILAEENIGNAADIVAAIEEHLAKVQTDVKLPILYLIDCIAKNIGGVYTELFSQNIVMTFCNVFKVVDEKTRSEMFKLRQTWNDIFPQKKLYAIDVQINMLDPAWPVTAKPSSNSIHFNPRFLTETPTTNMDTETITMQQKLIEKQKELIELQQKKLKLELLQTQVKLQKTLKNNKGNPLQKNLLLKPEVAKQLGSGGSSPKLKTTIASSQKTSTSTITTTTSNSATSSASATTTTSTIKPIRDPRLLRQQIEKSNNSTPDSNSSVSLGSKSSILDSNKVVANKMSVRDNRNEPRLINNSNNNKDSVPIQNKSESNTTTTTTKSTKTYSKSRQSEQKSPSKRNVSSNHNKNTDTTYPASSSSKSLNSVSLLDSPVSSSNNKNKSDKSDTKSPSKSPNRHKKKDYSNDKKSFKEAKRDRDNKRDKIDTSSSSSATFKGVKGSTKNRNYIRRNRSPSYSPEPSAATTTTVNQDVDFRVPVPEKQARLDTIDDNKKKTQGMDVDLRQLPAIVSKKRPSTETVEKGVPKKNKTEMFDVLFGNEDTDLRKQLPVVPAERPPTPPPPIISHNNISNNNSEKDSTKKSTHLDAVRAKLASATGRDKIMAKTFRKKRLQEDEDLRVGLKDSLNKIIISSDDEQCIKDGTMTKEQEKQLMNKIIAQIEHQKLREAQRKESVENIQILSDDEIVEDDNIDGKLGDKDDRINFSKYSKDRDTRRGNSYWRGSGVSGSGNNSNTSNSGSISGKRRHWDCGPHPRQQTIRPWLHQVGAWRPMAPNFIRPLHPDFVGGNTNEYSGNVSNEDNRRSPDIPNDLVVDSVNQDDIKTINIDGVPRDIRYYDETAIVFMNWDDPREISFQNGSRHVFFDKEIYLLSFNEPYKELNINSSIHKVRLGAPSREIFIDNKPYECYFGGPGITIDLNGQMTTVKLDGPPPQVKIGNNKRLDLVAGKVNLIIDAKILVPVFLDSKIQKFVIDGETHTLKFVDALKTVLINDVPFNVEFGGLPKPITVHDKKHFIRFSVLPRGIKPGYVNIKDMDGTQMVNSSITGTSTTTTTVSTITSSNSPIIDETSQDGTMSGFPNYDINEPALPVMSRKKRIDDDHDRNSNSPHFFQNFVQQNNLDVLSSVMTSSFASSTNNSGYQVENIAPNESSNQSIDNNVPKVNPVPLLPASVNINELFQKLVATGIVATSTNVGKSEAEVEAQNETTAAINKPAKRNVLENLKLVTFSKPETLKIRQNLLYDVLYSGMQCSSCGMRFPPEHSMHYSQHLDWHFRQNRKGKKNIRVAASRRWYYTLSDWKNFEEIEDLEEREKNYFDQQQQQQQQSDNVGGSGGGIGDDDGDDVDIPSVPADPDIQDAHCDVCQDKFDHFFNEEKEEWHLRNAIRVDNKTYHPLCYDDYQVSLQNVENDDKINDNDEDNVKDEKSEETNIPGLEIILDDDEDEIVEDDKEENNDDKNKDEVLIEESDESKPSTIEKPDESNTFNNDDDDDDDDVIINEVIPERIEVDDDDDYDYDKYIDRTTQDKPEMKLEQIDDGFMDVEEGLLKIKSGTQIKIKSEPIDPDDLPMEIDETQAIIPTQSQPIITPEPVRQEMITTIDGNIELSSTITTTTTSIVSGKIKINISKPLPPPPVVVASSSKDTTENQSAVTLDNIIDPTQPLPPGEEPPIQLNVKPALQGVELKKLPPVKKGSELTGMCSIM